MSASRPKSKHQAATLQIAGRRVKAGQVCDIDLLVSQSYSGAPISIPMRVWRAARPGPIVGVTGAVHGDELNGAGIVRELIMSPGFDLTAGTLMLVPVLNVLGLERHMRYLPDRRDLNRSFPGSAQGSLASRFANAIFENVVKKCDYMIDFHTAAVRRTNFPNVRADLSTPGVGRLAWSFGTELIVVGRGPKGSLRRSACAHGCPTIILEAGEVWKIEPTVVELGVRGVRNVLIELGMVAGQPRLPAYQVQINHSEWYRADVGGILQFHVGPGDVVEQNQPLATSTDLLAHDQMVMTAPVGGIVLGMTTLPMVNPGDPVVHLAVPDDGVEIIKKRVGQARPESLHERIRQDLATSFTVADPGNDES